MLKVPTHERFYLHLAGENGHKELLPSSPLLSSSPMLSQLLHSLSSDMADEWSSEGFWGRERLGPFLNSSLSHRLPHWNFWPNTIS